MFFRLTVAAHVVAIEISSIVYLTVASHLQAAFHVFVLKYGIGCHDLCICDGNTKDA